MSSTNRGSERQTEDFYATPAWCAHALLRTVDLPDGDWLEPAVGDGAIVKAVNDLRSDVNWYAIDIVNRGRIDGVKNCVYYDYLKDGAGCSFDVTITNPPYNKALEFVQMALKESRTKVVVMLLRLNWLASKARNRFLLDNPPSVYVLPKRPAFINGRTDSCEYAWFVWGLDATPKCQVIDIEVCTEQHTPKDTVRVTSLEDLFELGD